MDSNLELPLLHWKTPTLIYLESRVMDHLVGPSSKYLADYPGAKIRQVLLGKTPEAVHGAIEPRLLPDASEKSGSAA